MGGRQEGGEQALALMLHLWGGDRGDGKNLEENKPEKKHDRARARHSGAKAARR